MKTSVGKVGGGETKIAIEKIENSTEDPFGSRSSSTGGGRRSDRRGKRERKREALKEVEYATEILGALRRSMVI